MTILATSDWHCGHLLGLTPTKYQKKDTAITKIEEVGYNWFIENIRKYPKPDLLLHCGDIVDGQGRHDTSEHLTTDIEEQQEMSIDIFKTINAKKVIITRGTGYHVKGGYEYENTIAKRIDAQIFDDVKLQIHDTIVHARHVGSKGGTAYGSVTSAQRGAVVNILNAIEADEERPQIFINGHIHERIVIDRPLFMAITLPAMQFKSGGETSSTYGRKCTGFYTYGFMIIQIKPNNEISHKCIELKLSTGQKEKIIKVI